MVWALPRCRITCMNLRDSIHAAATGASRCCCSVAALRCTRLGAPHLAPDSTSTTWRMPCPGDVRAARSRAACVLESRRGRPDLQQAPSRTAGHLRCSNGPEIGSRSGWRWGGSVVDLMPDRDQAVPASIQRGLVPIESRELTPPEFKQKI